MSSWRAEAACVGSDVEIWFDTHRIDGGPLRADRTERALAICDVCPVVDECLDHALAAPEDWGVWGGRTEQQRASLKRRRRTA